MQTYILMTKLSPETSRQVKDRAKLGQAWMKQVKDKCPDGHGHNESTNNFNCPVLIFHTNRFPERTMLHYH